MALITCHECGKDVSTEAKNCPSCGAKVKPPKKPASKWFRMLLIVMGIGMIIGVVTQNAQKDADRQTAAAMTPEQLTQAKAKQDKENQILGIALAGAKTLRKSAKDSQTFEFTSIVTHPSASVCYEYRAKNSFNAMLAGSAVLASGKLLVQEHDGNAFVTSWNKNCTVADGTEVQRFITRLLDQ